MVSNPVCQAMESFHAANGMFHRNTDSRMRLVMFNLSGGEFRLRVVFRFLGPFMWQDYLRVRSILSSRPLKPQIEPYVDLVEPF